MAHPNQCDVGASTALIPLAGELLPPPLANTLGVSDDVVAELRDLAAEVEDIVQDALARNTVTRYSAQWKRFDAWCAARSIPLTLPTPAELVCLYLASWTTSDRLPAYSTVSQALAAIAWVHSTNSLAAPSSPLLTKMIKGLQRRLGVAPKRQAAPLRLDVIRTIGAALLQPTPLQLRDALVVAMRAAGLSYGEIVGLDTSSVVEITQTRCAIDVKGCVKTYAATGRASCAVASLNRWLRIRNTVTPGPLIVRVSADGELTNRAIPRQTVPAVIDKLRRRVDSLSAGRHLNPEVADELVTFALCPRPAAVRDLAVLLVAWAAGMRSDEVVHLLIGEVTIDREGMRLYIARSKTDQQGRGREKFVPRGTTPETDAVGAMERWIALLRSAGADSSTPILVPIDRHDTIITREVDDTGTLHVVAACQPTVMTPIVRNALRRANVHGIDIRAFSSHSAKRGIATELADAGADIEAIAHVLGNKDLKTARGYVETTQRRKQSPLRRLEL